jgi:PAS domain S-box-containing protein
VIGTSPLTSARNLTWTIASLALLAALLTLDLLTMDDLLLASMFAAAPVLASLGAAPAATVLVAVAAAACAVVAGAAGGEGFDRNDTVRVLTVVLVGNLAVWTALLRERMEVSTAEANTQRERYSTLLRALSEAGEGLVVLAGERAVYANEAMERLTGLPASDLMARASVFDLIEPDERDEARERARRRVDEEEVDREYRVRLRRADGSTLDVEVAGVPLETPEGSQLVVIVRDVSERVRTLRRSTFLAEASAAFDENLDEQGTLERIAALCVRDLALACVIILTEPGTEPQRMVAVTRDPAMQEALAQYSGSSRALSLDASNPMMQVARFGRPASVIDVPATLRDLGGPPASVRFAERLGAQSAVLVPLAARGRSHGVMALGFETLDKTELSYRTELFQDVARRAALALDNARLYSERAEVARTLQRSLLPSELPDVPGVELAARYVAAGEGNEVGGDFYDCFEGLGDEWVFVVGDVCGKGAEAAAITALARYTLRTSVLHGGGPVEALQELNEVLLRQHLDYRFCTVLCAMAAPAADGGLSVRLTSGGHPLPMLVTSDSVGQAGRPGTLLGVMPYPRLHEEAVHLAPGDALIMYTDGVIEASPLDDAFGPDRLADFIARLGRRGAGDVADAIRNQALELQSGVARDDIAVLVARSLPSEPAG